MRARNVVGMAIGALLGGGCLLTSDFDGLSADGESEGGDGSSTVPTAPASSSSSGSAPQPEVDGGDADAPRPWSSVPCLGKLVCLNFDEGNVPPPPWSQRVIGGGDLQASSTYASAPFALDVELADVGSGIHEAILYRSISVDSLRSRWGFDAIVYECNAALDAGGVQEDVMLAASSLQGGTRVELTLGPSSDQLVIDTLRAPLRARLPQNRWFHLDVLLETNRFEVLVDGVSQVTGFMPDGATASMQPKLELGLHATAPFGLCRVTFDNFYFEGVP